MIDSDVPEPTVVGLTRAQKWAIVQLVFVVVCVLASIVKTLASTRHLPPTDRAIAIAILAAVFCAAIAIGIWRSIRQPTGHR